MNSASRRTGRYLYSAGRRRPRRACARPTRPCRRPGTCAGSSRPSGLSTPFSSSVSLYVEPVAPADARVDARPAPSRRHARCRCARARPPARRTGANRRGLKSSSGSASPQPRKVGGGVRPLDRQAGRDPVDRGVQLVDGRRRIDDQQRAAAVQYASAAADTSFGLEVGEERVGVRRIGPRGVRDAQQIERVDPVERVDAGERGGAADQVPGLGVRRAVVAGSRRSLGRRGAAEPEAVVADVDGRLRPA